ncbi:hypothetical protein [Streptomyces sp. TRM70350]|uniref:hypothetical protein n=1 Tax=Streptomyces sp. TRM70350 TaxID=2856165 RepID=UPI001C46E884|nr:hypothetical protein [Streptomyces sp. TRM70350]MBV7698519.1 hypothetical protein [Streptomyces sp. TRM70350]
MERPPAQILAKALTPVRDEFSVKGADGLRVTSLCPSAWRAEPVWSERFGEWSMYRFLSEHARLDPNNDRPARRPGKSHVPAAARFPAQLHGLGAHPPGTRFYEIDGGTARLADALLARVRDRVRDHCADEDECGAASARTSR